MATLKFIASDSATAMEEVIRKLGPEALIVSTSKRGNKIEIEATNDPFQGNVLRMYWQFPVEVRGCRSKRTKLDIFSKIKM